MSHLVLFAALTFARRIKELLLLVVVVVAAADFAPVANAVHRLKTNLEQNFVTNVSRKNFYLKNAALNKHTNKQQ